MNKPAKLVRLETRLGKTCAVKVYPAEEVPERKRDALPLGTQTHRPLGQAEAGDLTMGCYKTEKLRSEG